MNKGCFNKRRGVCTSVYCLNVFSLQESLLKRALTKTSFDKERLGKSDHCALNTKMEDKE